VHLDDVTTALAATTAPHRDRFLAFVRANGDAALRRDGGPEHLTASCFVFSPDLGSVLLCLHRKGRFWVQFGGHLEPGDRDLADAARREAREESGIADLDLLDASVADLDRHDLHGASPAPRTGTSASSPWSIPLGRPPSATRATTSGGSPSTHCPRASRPGCPHAWPRWSPRSRTATDTGLEARSAPTRASSPVRAHLPTSHASIDGCSVAIAARTRPPPAVTERRKREPWGEACESTGTTTAGGVP
jgi:hypothetical protein